MATSGLSLLNRFKGAVRFAFPPGAPIDVESPHGVAFHTFLGLDMGNWRGCFRRAAANGIHGGCQKHQIIAARGDVFSLKFEGP